MNRPEARNDAGAQLAGPSEQAGEVEGVAANDVEALSAIVDASELVAGVAAARIVDAAEAAEKIAELEARLKPVAVVDGAEAEVEVEVEVTDAEIAEVVAELCSSQDY